MTPRSLALMLSALLVAGPAEATPAADALAAGRYSEAVSLGRNSRLATDRMAAARAASVIATYEVTDRAQARLLLEAAVADAQAAVAIDPDNPSLLLDRAIIVGYLGKVKASAGDAKASRRDVEAVLKRQPDNALAIAVLGGWHGEAVATVGSLLAGAALGAKKSESIRLFDKALALDPNSALFATYYAMTLLQLDASYAPRARALAKAKAIDPSRIKGTGPGGRIVEKDVRGYLSAHRYDERRISPAARNLAVQNGIDILTVVGTGDAGRIMISDVERVLAERPKKLSKMRQVIADRLTASFTTTPHFYVSVAVDMTALMRFRQELKERGQSYTVTDFILEAVTLSLKEFPALNSTCDGSTIRWRGTVDLGMAVALDDGLVVPVIRRAEDMTLAELHDVARDLAGRAREGKLRPDEMTGSSFTVSNMGMLNVDEFHAILNPPEAGILAVASTREKPVVRDGKIVVRSMMTISLSVDHRIVDGSRAAEFVNAIKNKLEDVELWKSMT